MKGIDILKARLLFAAFVVLSLTAMSLSAADNYAAGADGTQPLYLNSAARNGAYGNPALLGIGRDTNAGLSLILPVSVGLRSDEFAASALLSEYLFDVGDDWSRYAGYILWKSFDLKGASGPEEISRKLADGMRGNVGIHIGFEMFPLVFSMNGFAGSLKTYADVDVRLPGGALLVLFSPEEGLLRGSTVDLSALSAEAILATDLAFKMGRPINAMPSFFDYLNLDMGAWGVGAKYIMGHSYLSANTENSSLKYDSLGNVYNLDATVNILSTGTGLQNIKFDFDGDNTFVNQPVTGSGFGFDAGGVFHNDRHFVSVDMQDIGMIFWGKSATRKIKARLNRDDLLTDMRQTLDENKKLVEANDSLPPDRRDPNIKKMTVGGYFDTLLTENAEVDSGKGHITYLPLSLNLGYTYYHDLSDVESVGYWVKYLTVNADMKWQMISSPGKKAGAMLALGGSAGLVDGIFPLRYGIIVGGPGSVSSAVSVGVNTRHVSFDMYYKAVGHPLMMAKKGFETAAAFTVNWGSGKKRKETEDIMTNTADAASIPNTASDTTAAILPDTTQISPAMSLYREAKALVERITAELDAKDAAAEKDTAAAPVSDTTSAADTSSAPIPVPVPETAPDALPVPVPAAPVPAMPAAPPPAPVPAPDPEREEGQTH